MFATDTLPMQSPSHDEQEQKEEQVFHVDWHFHSELLP
jgi:hypothetical protein